MKKLFIISNESIFNYEGKYFCDNLDLKSTPEKLNKDFEINLIARRSSKVRSHVINLDNINIFRNFFTYLFSIFHSLKNKEAKYLVISISPYTFFACIFLKLFKKTPIVYLRSDGYGEYKAILGFLGFTVYHLMFSIVSRISHLISCREYILKGKKGAIVSPSQLNEKWLKDFKEINFDKIKLLYVGRLRVEKGIYSLLEIIKNNQEITLSIVGAEKVTAHNINQSNVNVYEIESNQDKLIKYYDEHNIFVLPSFTEGYPMALLESLARMRPVIIFEDIKHVIGDKKGIFVSKRNLENFLDTINHIKENYEKIQEEIRQNELPTNKNFIREMRNLILDLN
jgi:glycosyltransferase involved in cell wall biosynthesis